MGKESKGEGETRARRSGGLRRRRGFDRHFQERFLAVPEIGLEEGGKCSGEAQAQQQAGWLFCPNGGKSRNLSSIICRATSLMFQVQDSELKSETGDTVMPKERHDTTATTQELMVRSARGGKEGNYKKGPMLNVPDSYGARLVPRMLSRKESICCDHFHLHYTRSSLASKGSKNRGLVCIPHYDRLMP